MDNLEVKVIGEKVHEGGFGEDIFSAHLWTAKMRFCRIYVITVWSGAYIVCVASQRPMGRRAVFFLDRN